MFRKSKPIKSASPVRTPERRPPGVVVTEAAKQVRPPHETMALMSNPTSKSNLATYRSRVFYAFVEAENTRIRGRASLQQAEIDPSLGVQAISFDPTTGDMKLHLEEFDTCGGCTDIAETKRQFRVRLEIYCQDPPETGGGSFAGNVEIEMPAVEKAVEVIKGGRPLPACMQPAGLV